MVTVADVLRKEMTETGRITLYLVADVTKYPGGTTKVYEVTNKTGALKFLVHKLHHSTSHNIGRFRHDAWFKDWDGAWWHGVAYGNSTRLHCRRIKRKSRRMR